MFTLSENNTRNEKKLRNVEISSINGTPTYFETGEIINSIKLIQQMIMQIPNCIRECPTYKNKYATSKDALLTINYYIRVHG